MDPDGTILESLWKETQEGSLHFSLRQGVQGEISYLHSRKRPLLRTEFPFDLKLSSLCEWKEMNSWC